MVPISRALCQVHARYRHKQCATEGACCVGEGARCTPAKRNNGMIQRTHGEGQIHHAEPESEPSPDLMATRVKEGESQAGLRNRSS